MNHIERAGVYRSGPPSAKQNAAYQKAKEIKKLAYRQGRAKHPLTGWEKRAFDHIEQGKARGFYSTNLFAEVYQFGLAGLRIDGSQPKRKAASKVDGNRAAHG